MPFSLVYIWQSRARSGGDRPLIVADPAIAVDVLASGRLCAIPTETVYGLAANALNPQAVAAVFEAKNRPTNHPLIVHIAAMDALDLWIHDLPGWAHELAEAAWPGPLTLVGPRTSLASDAITGGQETVAVRIPDHHLTLEVLTRLHELEVHGVVAPSANRFGHVSPTTAQHVQNDLGEYLAAHDGVILDGGPCRVGVESTIVLATHNAPTILRPGGITRKFISEVTGLEILESTSHSPRVSGTLDSHYAPQARVTLLNTAEFDNQVHTKNPELSGAGLIAYRETATPDGMVRLCAPASAQEYAHELYGALRLADQQDLDSIIVVVPTDDGVAEAIRDRLQRAAF